MNTPIRLVTQADVARRPSDPSQVSVSARLDVELSGGRRVVLLDDRGWSSSGAWNQESEQDLRETALVVVGPDEPLDHQSYEEAATGYWEYLSGILMHKGYAVEPSELRGLPHEVELNQRLWEHIGTNPEG